MTVVTYRQNITGMMDCLIKIELGNYAKLTVTRLTCAVNRKFH